MLGPAALLRRTTMLRALPLLVILLFGPALAQADPSNAAHADDPGIIADAAVSAWLETEPLGIASAISTPAELCQALPTLLVSPPPPEGTRANLDDRQELPADDPDARTFTYSAVRPGDQLEVVQVVLARTEEGWDVVTVGFRRAEVATGRGWLQRPAIGWWFAALSLLVVGLMARPSFLRRWVVGGLSAVREHRRLVTITLVGLYTIFGLGALTGSQLPPECSDSVLAVVESAVASVGATEAYASGNYARAAAVTFYQNFVVVTVSVTYAAAIPFGIPAYLISALSFFVQAIPFGLLGAFSWPGLPLVLILLVLELTAYFLVVAGGGMLLATLIGKGFGALREAFTKLTLMLPLAMLLLLIGAWYEALIIIGF
jgi:hypothetical protein